MCEAMLEGSSAFIHLCEALHMHVRMRKHAEYAYLPPSAKGSPKNSFVFLEVMRGICIPHASIQKIIMSKTPFTLPRAHFSEKGQNKKSRELLSSLVCIKIWRDIFFRIIEDCEEKRPH